uniref:NAD(P)-binding domain-containing protein n=1 Tax=Erythrolobus madagascarensis TaxID=708628 RepID=A0A7S0XHU6_9RHOD|mmetsp:Transcript_2128/g.4742  ORF Transcript_2128/g.4742 Transcript_2128/m.4742 type:complete len:534 (+) Transcript_2128:191-1792(+)
MLCFVGGALARVDSRWGVRCAVRESACGRVHENHHSVVVARNRSGNGVRMAANPLGQVLSRALDALSGSSSSSDGSRLQSIASVLVIGATGKTGSEVVRSLREMNPNLRVFAGCRDGSAQERGVSFDEQIDMVSVDVTEEGSITGAIQKVKPDAIVWTVGSRTPREVDAEGLAKVVAAFSESASGRILKSSRTQYLFDFTKNGGAAASRFSPLDDVIMGGVSASRMDRDPISSGGLGAAFTGYVSLDQNGGFCQARAQWSPSSPLNLVGYDGIELVVRGDGRRYKVNLKNTAEPEFVFQASFDTIKGERLRVRLPFSDFLPTKRGKLAYTDGSSMYSDTLALDSITAFSLVVSKIETGGMTNSAFAPGEFKLELESISAFYAIQPRFVLLSSAAVTRPFWTEEEKAAYSYASTIPIVQLNPGNVLGEKLRGEDFLRASGLPYCIVRATGLNDKEQPMNSRLVLTQGDRAVGRIHRKDLAKGISYALQSPQAAFKTFEIESKPPLPMQSESEMESDFARLQPDCRLQLSPQSIT